MAAVSRKPPGLADGLIHFDLWLNLLEQAGPCLGDLGERSPPVSRYFGRGIGRKTCRQIRPIEAGKNPVHQCGCMRVVQLRLRDARNTQEITSSFRRPGELGDLARKRRCAAFHPLTFRTVAPLAMQPVIAVRVGHGRNAPGESEEADRDAKEQSAVHSLYSPRTIAVEQWYTTLSIPKHQLMSLLRCA